MPYKSEVLFFIVAVVMIMINVVVVAVVVTSQSPNSWPVGQEQVTFFGVAMPGNFISVNKHAQNLYFGVLTLSMLFSDNTQYHDGACYIKIQKASFVSKVRPLFEFLA